MANLHPQAIFQHDPVLCHKAKIMNQYFKKMKMEVLEWPDLHGIENQWSIVKNRLGKQDYTIKMILVQYLIHLWFHNDKINNVCKKLVLSMKKRLDLINPADKKLTYQLLIAIKIKFTFFDFQIKVKCLKIVSFFSCPDLHKSVSDPNIASY